MKKVLLSLGLVFIASVSAFSQWNTNGGYLFAKNNRVVIGDSVPPLYYDYTGMSVISKHDIDNGGGNGIASFHSTDNNYLKFNSRTQLGYTSNWASQSQCASIAGNLFINKDNASEAVSRSAGAVFNISFDNYSPIGNYTHYLSGSHSMLSGTFSSYPSNSIISAVIGEDLIGNNSTFAGYFIGRGYYSGNVGIGTTITNEKLNVKGNIKFEDIDNGFILKSPNGNEWKVTIDNNGNLSASLIPTFINNPSIDNNIVLYPNPSSDEINFNIKDVNLESVNVEILNIEGKLIFMKSYKTLNGKINISDLEIGTYIVNVKGSNGAILKSEKIIKK